MESIMAAMVRNADGGYSVYTEDELFSGIGKTPGEARKDMIVKIEMYKDFCRKKGYPCPRGIAGDYEIRYRFNPSEVI